MRPTFPAPRWDRGSADERKSYHSVDLRQQVLHRHGWSGKKIMLYSKRCSCWVINVVCFYSYHNPLYGLLPSTRNQKREEPIPCGGRGAAVPNILLYAITTHGQGCGPYEANGAFVGYKTPTGSTQSSTVAAVQSHIGANGNSNFLTASTASFQKLLNRLQQTWSTTGGLGLKHML